MSSIIQRYSVRKDSSVLSKLSVAVIMLVTSLSWSEVEASEPEEKPQLRFFENLKGMCGQVYKGTSDFPRDPKHALAGKVLQAIVQDCSDHTIKIPFIVGEDKSRTWHISITENGLLLKHEHRHSDGTLDEVTNYGGHTQVKGTSHKQSFPADELTQTLIPEAKTNVWQLILDPAGRQITYYLTRHGKPRFRATLTLVSN